MAVIINGTTGIDKVQDGSIGTADIAADAITTPKIASSVNLGRRNLVDNGAMQVAQRGSSAVTIGTSGDTFRADRFRIEQGGVTANNGTIEVVADAPTGFKYSTKLTGGSSVTQNSAGFAAMSTRIEGSDLDHIGHGSSAAKNVTLSFWVKSSVTGTYSLNMTKYDGTLERWQVKTYTISTANTWEYKTLTFSGDTSNTAAEWLRLYWQVGGDSGAYTNTTPDVWINGAGTKRGTSSQPNFLGTSGATFNLTGVQLEAGDTATPFEHRSYGEELSLCQRYFYRHADNISRRTVAASFRTTASDVEGVVTFPNTMRAVPTFIATSGTDYYRDYCLNNGTNTTSVSAHNIYLNNAVLQWSGHSRTAGQAGYMRTNNASATVDFDAEL